jgi:hypothetical protein
MRWMGNGARKRHQKCIQNSGQKMLQDNSNQMDELDADRTLRQIIKNRWMVVGSIQFAQIRA